jgi:hypothetical protein
MEKTGDIASRALKETIRTQMFPPQSLPSTLEGRADWLRKTNADKNEFSKNEWDKPRPVNVDAESEKKLLIRAYGDILFSRTLVVASPVTRCIPTRRLLDVGHEAYLPHRELHKIEELLGSRSEIEELLGSASIADSLAEPPEENDGYRLVLGQKGSKSSAILRLQDHVPYRINHHQSEFLHDQFDPDWTIELGLEFFSALREKWARPWFEGRGKFNHINRPANVALTLEVTENDVSIIFNQDEDGDGYAETIAFPQSVEMSREYQSSFFSEDIAPILYNLADAPVAGDIVVEANRHAIVFSYETTFATFEIAVPSLKEDRQTRDATHFCSNEGSFDRL